MENLNFDLLQFAFNLFQYPRAGRLHGKQATEEILLQLLNRFSTLVRVDYMENLLRIPADVGQK